MNVKEKILSYEILYKKRIYIIMVYYIHLLCVHFRTKIQFFFLTLHMCCGYNLEVAPRISSASDASCNSSACVAFNFSLAK